MEELIRKVKEKREFSELPSSVVERALKLSGGDVKETRAFLRKYFGVFLTNKVLKAKGDFDEVLKSHISSKKRDYDEFYSAIFSEGENVSSIVDLGCGVNGFSYPYLKKLFGNVNYLGIEASGQVVKNTNSYFKEKDFENAKVLIGDLFEVEEVVRILKGFEKFKPRVVFLFQVVDALENFEKDFSKKFLFEISKNCEKIVLSFPLVSLGGRKKFEVKRKWLVDFLEENFKVEKDFEIFSERVIVFQAI
jgi:hypothetical protein